MSMDPLLEQLLAGFVDESQEIYDRVTRSLMELEKEPAQGPRFDELARGLHTLKGSAATLGLEELADFAHRMEDVVLPLRGSAQPLPGPLADAVLKSLDTWMARLRATAQKGELPDLSPSYTLLAQVKPAANARTAADGKAAAADGKAPATSGEHKPAAVETLAANVAHATEDAEPAPAADDASGDSWRVEHPAGDRPASARWSGCARCACASTSGGRDLDQALQQLDRLGLAGGGGGGALRRSSAWRRALGADGEEARGHRRLAGGRPQGHLHHARAHRPRAAAPRGPRHLQRERQGGAAVAWWARKSPSTAACWRSCAGRSCTSCATRWTTASSFPRCARGAGKHREGALTIRVEQQGNMLFLEVADDGAGLDLEAHPRGGAASRGAGPRRGAGAT